MQISELGEFALIDRLTAPFAAKDATTLLGVGDDAALLAHGEQETLVSTDMLMEGIHFDLVYCPLQHLGYKAAVVNFSDIYAMGGRPRQLLVSLALSQRFTVEDCEAFYAGVKHACERYGVDLVGGDTTASLTGMAISLTVIGTVAKGQAIRRSGAQNGELICCTGNLGAAYMGLQLMEREKGIYLSQLRAAKSEEARAAVNFQPDFAGREYLLERYLKPEARASLLDSLAALGLRPTAMIDISDGLSSELLHLCKASDVGCRVWEERLPIDYQTAVAAEELNLNVSTCALNGGEDYELLFTLPLTAHELVSQLPEVKVIGHICPASQGAALITRDGQEFALRAQGWNALTPEHSEG